MAKKISIFITTITIFLIVGILSLKFNVTCHYDKTSDYVIKTKFYEPLELVSPQKTGYDFEGWYLDENYSKKLTSDYKVIQNTDVYAKWEKHNYQVRLHNIGAVNENGDTALSDQETLRVFSYSLGEGVKLPNLVQEGYDFLGWVEKKSNDTDHTSSNIADTAENSSSLYINTKETDIPSNYSSIVKGISLTTCKDLDLYPVFQNSVYNLTCELNGGSCDNLPESYTYGEEITFPTPTKSGYTFCGWYFDEKCTDSAAITAETTGDKTIYAAWKKNIVVRTTNTSSSTDTASSSSIKLNITDWFELYRNLGNWTSTETRVACYTGTSDPYDNKPAWLIAHLGHYYGNTFASLNVGDMFTFNGATYQISSKIYTEGRDDPTANALLYDGGHGTGNHVYLQTCADYSGEYHLWIMKAELIS